MLPLNILGSFLVIAPGFTAAFSDATAWLKMAEPAELSHFEPSRAIKLAHNQNGLGSAHGLAQPG